MMPRNNFLFGESVGDASSLLLLSPGILKCKDKGEDKSKYYHNCTDNNYKCKEFIHASLLQNFYNSVFIFDSEIFLIATSL